MIHEPVFDPELFHTADRVRLVQGMEVWLYPADCVIGGTIEKLVVGSVTEDGRKIIYDKPDVEPDGSEGYVGARVDVIWFYKENAEACRAIDVELERREQERVGPGGDTRCACTHNQLFPEVRAAFLEFLSRWPPSELHHVIYDGMATIDPKTGKQEGSVRP